MRNRYDVRTKEQFKDDIKKATATEAVLMAVYVDWLNTNLDADKYTFSDHGIDNTGEFIEDGKKVTHDADFILQRKGKRNKKIDIKFCREERTCSHLKVSQLDSYVQDDVCIVNFMGLNGTNPRFCIIPPKDIVEWLRVGERVKFFPWGGQLCIKLPNEEMTWHNVDLKGQKF